MGTLTFTQALERAELLARQSLPVELHDRLSCAVALVKDGRVFQGADGEWQVDSSSTEGLVYSVNGTCSCHDAHFNKPAYCKHRLAMFLSQRAMSLMAQPPAPVVPAQAAQEPQEPTTTSQTALWTWPGLRTCHRG